MPCHPAGKVIGRCGTPSASIFTSARAGPSPYFFAQPPNSAAISSICFIEMKFEFAATTSRPPGHAYPNATPRASRETGAILPISTTPQVDTRECLVFADHVHGIPVGDTRPAARNRRATDA